GRAGIVATSGALADSMMVTVPAAGNAVVFATSRGRVFASPSVNDTLSLDVTADMAFTPTEKLGSYGATLTWDPTRLQLDTVLAGDFPPPTVNFTARATGQIQFASANPNGSSGQSVLARVRF